MSAGLVDVPRVLSIAGTDPTGGAGIHADLKTIGALGGYGMAVVTALVAQNTQGVRAVHVPDARFLREQLDAVSDDVHIDAVKLGMLHSTPLIDVVTAWLDRVEPPIVVLDPVMVATSGDRLLDTEAEEAIWRLTTRVHLVTPNLPELAVLVGGAPADSWETALDQARRLNRDTGTMVLLKGGHLDGDQVTDAIVTTDSVAETSGARIDSTNTHGTGCSLSSAIATLAASGHPWPIALERSKTWLTGAIAHGAALGVGRGNGPIDHLHELRPHLAAVRWCESRWNATTAVREQVDLTRFVSGLRDGTLDRADFTWYLAQDALYLREYSRLLSMASVRAPSSADQAFWAASAVAALAEEESLHRSHIGDDPITPSDTTRRYLDHLRDAAADGSYGVLVAAVLPCFWLYADLGSRLVESDGPDHPFHDWLQAYADPAFAEATRQAIEVVDTAAAAAGADERHRMAEAFDRSMADELAFFAAPTRPRDA